MPIFPAAVPAAVASLASVGAGFGLLTSNGDVVAQLGTRVGELADDARQVVRDLASTAGTAAINQVCGVPAEEPDANQQQQLEDARQKGVMTGVLRTTAAGAGALAIRHFSDSENRAAAYANMQAAGNSIKDVCGAGMAMFRAANDAFEMHVADPSVPEYGQPLQAAEDGQRDQASEREQALLAQLEAAQQELAALRSAQDDGDLLPLGEARKDMLEQMQQDGAQLLPQPVVPALPKLKKLKVAQLRLLCTQLGLSTDGLKPVLVKRLNANR